MDQLSATSKVLKLERDRTSVNNHKEVVQVDSLKAVEGNAPKMEGLSFVDKGGTNNTIVVVAII